VGETIDTTVRRSGKIGRKRGPGNDEGAKWETPVRNDDSLRSGAEPMQSRPASPAETSTAEGSPSGGAGRGDGDSGHAG
jgi:hypothetical protein